MSNLEENAFELWKKQKQEERMRKIREQQEIKEMMEKYWPWNHERTKPRAKSNLFLEEIYPIEEYGKVKRATELPEYHQPKRHGHRQQFFGKKYQGSKESSATSIKSKNAEIYKKDLEQQIAEKKQAKEREEKENKEMERNLGWSDNNILKNIAKENDPKYNEESNVKITSADPKIVAIREYSKSLKNCTTRGENPGNGMELVRVLAKERILPRNYSLSSTDVTKVVENRVEIDNDYSKNLKSQVNEKQNRMKANILEDFESSRQHFNTLDSFWGRPGHGAPMPIRKKLRLDNLLYPQTRPVGVH